MRKSDRKMFWSMFSFIVNLLWDIRDYISVIPPHQDNGWPVNHYSKKEYDKLESKSREWIEEE
jgi:hypothetical protein